MVSNLELIFLGSHHVDSNPISNFFSVSGPDPLVSTVRSALSSSFAGPLNVLKGGPTIQLNVESFTM